MNARILTRAISLPRTSIAAPIRATLPALYAGNGLALSGLRWQMMTFAWIDVRLGLVITGLLAIALNLMVAKRSNVPKLR